MTFARKRLAILAATIALFAAAVTSASAAERRDIDASASQVRFSARHVYIDTVSGSVPISEGFVLLGAHSAVPEAVRVTLDATRFASGDDDRDSNLQGPDWFDTKRFPTWTFVSSVIRGRGPSAFEMDGLLTIHGVTRQMRLDVVVSGDPERPLYRAVGHLDRHAFGMTVTRLDPIIGSDVTISLAVRLK